MLDLIDDLLEVYKQSPKIQFKRVPINLGLYLTEDGEFHLFNFSAMGNHRATSSRYSNKAQKHISFIKDILKDEWKIQDLNYTHAHFLPIEEGDLTDDWLDKVIVKKPYYLSLWSSVSSCNTYRTSI